MERREFLKLTAAAALAAPLARPAIAQAPATVRWWYHFDNPQNSPAALVAKFEQENPGIKVQAEAIPWGGGNDYQTRLFAALVAGNGPDAAMVRLSWAARLAAMKALEPLDAMIARLGRPQRHLRQHLEDQQGRRTASSTTCRCNTW